MVELVLQVTRAGGDDDLVAAAQGRHQVREGLADTGTGLAHQRATARQRVLDGVGQRLLAGARREAIDGRRERPVGVEQPAGVRHRLRIRRGGARPRRGRPRPRPCRRCCRRASPISSQLR
ncbi:MAG: hypothetical protein U5K43_09420 [Halofilum sp. (in: g-proteobacteria)]|nr:hypothetical protein [Halofilum sp. (in: g-proteobacteria)]